MERTAILTAVIPGLAKREPGIHFTAVTCGPMDSGLALCAPRNDGWKYLA